MDEASIPGGQYQVTKNYVFDVYKKEIKLGGEIEIGKNNVKKCRTTLLI